MALLMEIEKISEEKLMQVTTKNRTVAILNQALQKMKSMLKSKTVIKPEKAPVCELGDEKPWQLDKFLLLDITVQKESKVTKSSKEPARAQMQIRPSTKTLKHTKHTRPSAKNLKHPPVMHRDSLALNRDITAPATENA